MGMSSLSNRHFRWTRWQDCWDADWTPSLEVHFLVFLIVATTSVVMSFEATLVAAHLIAFPPTVLAVGHIHGHIARTDLPWTGSRQLTGASSAPLYVIEIVTEPKVEHRKYEVCPVYVTLYFEYINILLSVLLVFAPAVREAL